jgi:hypothetical protein
LIYVPRVELRHVVGLLGLLRQRSRVAHSLRCRGHDGSHSWFPHHAGWINAADEWARSPLIVSGMSCSLDGEEAKALSTPRTILSMDLEWLLWYLLRYK